MKKCFFSFLVATGVAAAASAQEAWTLERCVDYAIEHNISVKNARLQVEQGEVEVTSAKNAFLPTLSANASEGVNFGRGLTADNTYANRNTSSFQWGAQASIPLFQGLSDVRQLAVARESLKKYILENASTCDDVTLNVISQYLQVLYAKEVEQSAQSQLSYSTFEVRRQQALVDEGKVAEANLYDAQAQQAQDSLTLVSSQNDVHVALVTLANLLQLASADGFDVAPINDATPAIPGPDVVYSRALERNNGVLAARQGIEVAKSQISLAKTGYIPRLSMDASVGSTYYTVAGMNNEPFGTQMRNNFSTYLGVRLSVPIFDAFSTRNNVSKARLGYKSAVLELDRRESDLYKAIQLAYTQAIGARDKYLASEVTLEKTTLSFSATREKYSLGRATPTEFEQAKNNLFRVEVQRIQAYYEYLLRYRILRFYEQGL